MLKPFGPDIWIHDGGPITGALGFRYPTRMAVIRLAGGSLFVWSPTAISDDLRRAVDDLGPVRLIIAPNTLHHSFLADWCAAYPEARLFGLPDLRAARQDLAFAGNLTAAPPNDWADEIDQVILPGTSIMTEVVFFHRASGTVLFTDLLQNLPPNWYSSWRNVIARLDLMTMPEPTVPRKFRMAFGGKRAMRAAVDRILAWPAERVMMAHGTPVTSNVPAFLRRAFGWLP